MWPGTQERKKVKVLVVHLTLCNPVDCSPPLLKRILQARILEWVAIASSRRSSLTQGSNPGLLHCRQTLYLLRHQGILAVNEEVVLR